MLEGVQLSPIKIVTDERGSVIKMFDANHPNFHRFGEIYFSVVNPGFVKAWKLHKASYSNLMATEGHVHFVLYDAREGSSTFGQFQEVDLNSNDRQLLVIPPGIMYGWKNAIDHPSTIANCASETYSPEESVNPPRETLQYDWGDGK